MTTLLITFGPPLILSAAGLYAVVVYVRYRRRQQRGLPARHRTPLTEARQRLMAEVEGYRKTRAEVEQIMSDAHAKFGPLYDKPTREDPTRQHADH